MDRRLAPCRRCGTAVPDDATACPACSYAVASHDRHRLALGATGTALTLSLLFAPIGLPLLWAAYRHRLAAAGTVTTPAGPAPFEHVGEVLRTQLSLNGGRGPGFGGSGGRPGGHTDRAGGQP